MTRAALVLALLAAPSGTPALAMEMRFAPDADGTVSLVLQGPIDTGDAQKLRETLRRRPRDARIGRVVLNSPGGSVAEAKDMARLVLQAPAPVLVPARGVCASACFLLFAAGRHKEAQPGAMVGVHSASVGRGQENLDTLGVTTLMAREAASYGVPAAITGRMVTTQPGQMAWLSRDELTSMGTRILDGGAGAGEAVTERAGQSDWARGFAAGQALPPGGACAAPPGVDPAQWGAGCDSGHLSGGGKVAAAGAPGTGSDWSRGFAYGQRDPHPDCDHVDAATTVPGDFRLGCESGLASR